MDLWWKLPFRFQSEQGEEGSPGFTVFPFDLLGCGRPHSFFVFIVEVVPLPVDFAFEERLAASVSDFVPESGAVLCQLQEVLVLFR